MEISPKSKKAVEIFSRYKAEIETISSKNEGNIWKAKVLESISLYIGDGEIKRKFSDTYFTKVILKTPRSSGSQLIMTKPIKIYEYDPNQKPVFTVLLNTIIDHITNNGVLMSVDVRSINNTHSEPVQVSEQTKTNFLGHLGIAELLTWLGAIAVAIFGIGYYVGTQKVDRDYVDLKQEKLNLQTEVKRLNDTIRKIDAENYAYTTRLESENKVLNSACTILNEKLNK